MVEAVIWKSDAPEGFCWECPECGHQASLGGNMGYHRATSGHIKEAPVLVEMDTPKRLTCREKVQAEIADWLEGQADKFHATALANSFNMARGDAYRAAAEAVRQGRARREGA